jgi:hypothetical protein
MRELDDYKRSSGIQRKRAMGPIIATLILSAVTIAFSLTTWYLIPRAAAEYTSIESIEISTAICTIENGNWTIRVNLRNTGTTTVTFAGCFINDIEVDSYGEEFVKQNEWTTSMIKAKVRELKKKLKITEATIITSGQTKIVNIFIDPERPNTSLSSGTRIHIRFRTSSGMDYIILAKLV